jgi:hypothetical protein
MYRENLWGSQESRSGVGSTLKATEGIRQILPTVFRQFEINSILDAPCGDFNWMQYVVLPKGCRYIGADLVEDLIQSNTRSFSDGQRSFCVLDILQDSVPQVDLWLCRDCLFHFSYSDVAKALGAFVDSGSKYFLTTTHLPSMEFSNSDIRTGDFRRIDLFAPPFNLPKEVLFRFDDYAAGDFPREMCLWSNGQISAALTRVQISATV